MRDASICVQSSRGGGPSSCCSISSILVVLVRVEGQGWVVSFLLLKTLFHSFTLSLSLCHLIECLDASHSSIPHATLCLVLQAAVSSVFRPPVKVFFRSSLQYLYPFIPFLCCLDTTHYTPDHEWLRLNKETRIARMGITDYAQQALGDVVFVELPTVGKKVSQKGKSSESKV